MEPWLEGGKFSDWEYVYKILGKPYNKNKQNKWQKKNQIGILAIMVIRNFEKFSSYLIIITISYLFVDMALFRLLGHGYPSNRDQEKIQRLPTPYDFFSGK